MLPALRIGFHRVGVSPDLDTRPAFWDNEAAPAREAIGCVFVDRATMPPVGSGESDAKLSLLPMGADGRAVIAVVCGLGIKTRWSILLTLRDLTLPSTIVAGGTLARITH